MYPHRIRLIGPWEFEPLARTWPAAGGRGRGRADAAVRDLPPAGRMRIPAPWTGTALDGFRGRVRWRRGFHAPRSLAPDERLWLVFDGVDYFADVTLNGTRLGGHEGYFEPFEFEITSLIRPHNELVVEVDCPNEKSPHERRLMRGEPDARNRARADGIWREVALEVRSVAFLSDVAVRADLVESRGVIQATGRIMRHADVSLTLELGVDGEFRTAYEFPAAAVGAEFQMETVVDQPQLWWPRPHGEPRTYRVVLELHGQARTLDARRVTVGFRTLQMDESRSTAEFNGRRMSASFVRLDEMLPPGQFDATGALRRDAITNRLAADAGTLVLIDTQSEVLEPGFYDAADANGFCVWQDSPARATPATDPTLAAEARRQTDVMVRLLGHHASVVLDPALPR